jgi:Fic family protein
MWRRSIVSAARSESSAAQRSHPLLCIGVLVVVFLQIHPFQDGNGRLSRLLTLLLLLRAGYSHAPYASLERLIERRREAYDRTLRQTQGTLDLEHPDWTPWLAFFVEVLHERTRELGRRLRTEQDLTAPSADRAAILRHVQERGSATMRDLVLLTGLARNTLKGHLRALVNDGQLVLYGAGRGSRYRVP